MKIAAYVGISDFWKKHIMRKLNGELKKEEPIRIKYSKKTR